MWRRCVLEWRHRPLEAFCPVIYLDAIRIKKIEAITRWRTGPLTCRSEWTWTVLSMCAGHLGQTDEGAAFWATCAELANQGVRDVLIVCCDRLSGKRLPKPLKRPGPSPWSKPASFT